MNQPRDWDRWGAVLVSFIITFGFIAILVLMFYKPIEFSANTFTVLNVMIGVLGTAFGQVVNYWLGSSSGSRRKDEAMQSIAQAAVTTPEVK